MCVYKHEQCILPGLRLELLVMLLIMISLCIAISLMLDHLHRVRYNNDICHNIILTCDIIQIYYMELVHCQEMIAPLLCLKLAERWELLIYMIYMKRHVLVFHLIYNILEIVESH